MVLMTSRIGVDESGKGDYFGYLVVAGVIVDEEKEKKLAELRVKDSKKMLDSTALRTARDIKKICTFDVVEISPEKYNELYKKFKNLNALLAWGHARVIENLLKENKCDFVVTDKFGDEKYLKKALMEKGGKISVLQKVRGESDMAVAAASVIARAEFLRTLKKMSLDLGFKLPKGATHVEDAALALMDKYGKEILPMVAKTHFKITKSVMKTANDRT